MTDDLVTRAKMAHIHDRHTKGPEGLYGELANHITALEAENARLRGALKPFAHSFTELEKAKKLFDPDWEQTRSILYAGEEAYSRAAAAMEG